MDDAALGEKLGLSADDVMFYNTLWTTANVDGTNKPVSLA